MSPQPAAVRDESPFLSVLIPALNEEATIDAVVEAVLAVPVSLEVILIDDGSTDGTWGRMQRWARHDRVAALRHGEQRGKGAAIRTALTRACGSVILVQDADMEYDINDYPRLLDPIIKGRAQVVYGTRVFASHTAHSYWYVMGNKGVTTAANLLFNVYLSDIETAYKVFPREAALAMNLEAKGFEIDPEITAKLLRMGYRIHEVPVDYVARSREEGKKIRPSDGVKALGVLLRHRFWKPGHIAPMMEVPGRHARPADQHAATAEKHVVSRS
ncbi:MAG: glycosyltransferase family 2 protein [Candidatus Dormibacteraeota bacterium]|uniref:Glycosyl transferase n=1 Tax=Candidatus Aeolococcus gillhamiae TaxID=3127015 RepID=A0A2W5Z5D4_9BACT|nr:glycosyltransferase family 2 protein [Candidatus Dormibacteraeota bacterium]PZR80473.1 MAG: glycosyl transferase [Candidatus Dormibacter sp. RRmetagenome_bin12]